MLSRSIENAQKAIEGRNFGIRKHTLQYDEVMNEQRKLIYSQRLSVLRGEDVHDQIVKYIPDYVRKVVGETVNTDAMPEQWDAEALNGALVQKVYPDECKFEITPERLSNWDYDSAIDKIVKEVTKAYEEKLVNIKKDTDGQVDYRQVERNELLRAVDRNWIDHIDAMDQLRKGIGLRGYAQQDPVIAYKEEGHEMFEEMIERIQTTTVSRLLKGRIIKIPAAAMQRNLPLRPPVTRQMVQQQQQAKSIENAQPEAQAAPVQEAKPVQDATPAHAVSNDYQLPKDAVIHRPDKNNADDGQNKK
jgi:preprotein translocase subunit SecA